MADNTLVKVAIFGGAGYLAYSMGWLSFLGLSPSSAAAPAPAGGTATTTTTVVNPNPPAVSTPPATPAPSVLDGIFARIQAKAGNVQLDPDNWGWYLNNELAAVGKGAAPDPVPLFGQRPFTAMSAAQWWGPMSAALRSQMGLSGLGIYGGLSALARRRR